MDPFIQGILMGLTITVSIGPGFMALFQTSMIRGVKAGFVLAIGILMSDLALIGLSYFGLSSLLVNENTLIMGVVAGLILIVFGTVSLLRKSTVNLDLAKLPVTSNRLPILLIKGFLLNVANPFVLIFWIGIMGFAASNYGMHSYGFFIFFLGMISTAFSSDLMKCYLSGFLKKTLASETITVINKVIGAIFILVGMFVISKVIMQF